MSAVMSTADLREFTGYVHAAQQRRMLDEHGIPYQEVMRRGQAALVVMNQHVALWVEGRPVQRSVEPDFSNVR